MSKPCSSNLSREVSSNQTAVHEHLKTTVITHLKSHFHKPVAHHSVESYNSAIAKINRPKLIFDSGCGTGRSTIALARQFPEAFIIGIDKSSARLAKTALHNNRETPDNFCLQRANLIDFLRLASEDGISLYRHYFLYPNPWPKKRHLQRRWHGSPVFKNIIALGGQIELRSNWKTYLEEFAIALEYAGRSAQISKLAVNTENPISDFEQKYARSDHALWQLISPDTA